MSIQLIPTSEKALAIHTATEASDPQRMGTDRQRCMVAQKHQIHPHTHYR